MAAAAVAASESPPEVLSLPTATMPPPPTDTVAPKDDEVLAMARQEEGRAAAARYADDQALARALQAEEDSRMAHQAQSALEARQAREARELQDAHMGMMAAPHPMHAAAGGSPMPVWGTSVGPPKPEEKSCSRMRCMMYLFISLLVTAALSFMVYEFLLKDMVRGDPDPNEESWYAFEETNNLRREQGLPELEWSPHLEEIAVEHATQVANGEAEFSHQGFQRRMAKYPLPYEGSGENLAAAACNNPAEFAVNGWKDSPEHRANLEGDWTKCAVGAALSEDGTWYITQLFVRD